MIALDTTAIIDLFRGDEAVRKFFENNTEPIAATIMNYAELFFGLDPDDSSHSKESEYYKGLFDGIYHFNLSESACEKASSLYWELQKNGTPIGQFDCIIAGILVVNGVKKILTRNVKHYSKIKELKAVPY
ncbi:type II toxin-antitoxin system VapC family toxin [Candidatus Woesearchaeota archaeon]|nr:type II toxin-antitoxin system VapC family toxin [Candidatus Woesearchaeota archaeon]